MSAGQHEPISLEEDRTNSQYGNGYDVLSELIQSYDAAKPSSVYSEFDDLDEILEHLETWCSIDYFLVDYHVEEELHKVFHERGGTYTVRMGGTEGLEYTEHLDMEEVQRHAEGDRL